MCTAGALFFWGVCICRQFGPACAADPDLLTCARAENVVERGAEAAEQLVRNEGLDGPAEAAAVNPARAAPLQREIADRKRNGRRLFFMRAGRVYILQKRRAGCAEPERLSAWTAGRREKQSSAGKSMQPHKV